MKTIILLFILLSSNVFATELQIEPVYGFERSYQHTPKPGRYRTEVFTGIKGTYGTEIIAGELELNQGSTTYQTGTDSTGLTDVKTNTQNLLIGLKLVPFIGEYYNINFRGGLRGRKETREITFNGDSTTKSDGVQWDPYAGTGVSLNFASLFSLNASATLIYNREAEEGEKYDTRFTLGAGIKFGNKSF